MTGLLVTMELSRKGNTRDSMLRPSAIFFLSFIGLIMAVSATFLITPAKEHNDASNICIYSADPTKYAPKCFVCLNAVYPNALQACVNTTVMPSNISYSQAQCVEKNCAINFPQKPSASQPSPLASLPGKLAPLIDLLKHKMKKRSINNDDDLPDGNSINFVPYIGDGENKLLLQLDKIKDMQITRQIETYASEQVIAEAEDDEDDANDADDYY